MVEESTRRLPNWMLGITAGAGGVVASDGDHDDRDSSGNHKKKKKLRPSDITESKEENANLATNSIEEKEILTRNPERETRRRKRNRIENDDIENLPNKKKNDLVKRNQKAKRDKKEKWINGSSSCVENDEDIKEEEELTIEDLVRIAEEYVKADEDSQKRQLVSRECESQRQMPTKQCSSSGLEVIPNNVNASYSSMESLVNEQSLISASRIGDPAQDMLDLFLGPLLKKPIEKEKRSEFVTKDLDFATYDLESGNQNDVGGEMVLPMKKKSSLKDKVSVLLD